MQRTQLGLAVMALAGCLALGGEANIAGTKTPEAESPTAKDIVECRLHLGPAKPGAFVDLYIDDPALIRELVLDPIGQANRDPNPANYVILGGLTVTRRDGSKEHYAFFAPWGHFSKKGEYFITDLGKLRTTFLQRLDGARACLGPRDEK